MKTKSKRLKRMLWRDYIYSCFVNFILDNSKYEKKRGEMHFTGGVRYSWKQTANRNPKVVSQELWEELLLRHLKNLYN